MYTANCVQGAEKDFFYVSSGDVESLMNINEIDHDTRPEIFRRIILMQDISNGNRANRPKRKGK